MTITQIITVLVLTYLIGSFPVGVIIVKLLTGQDVRKIQSGRTGGTNVMRAAGFWPGLTTAILDVGKGIAAVWVARNLAPGSVWLEVFAPVVAILGHNYSIFLPSRDEWGKIRLTGGAGGATCLGGAIGLWAGSVWFILPIAIFILFGVGYASVATLSIAGISILIFLIRAYFGYSPWAFTLYGIGTLILLAWALRPNIQRLRNGTERLVGWRAKRKKV